MFNSFFVSCLCYFIWHHRLAPVEVEPYWPKLFANLLANRDIGDLLLSGGGGAAPAPAAGGAVVPAAAAGKAEKKKEEPKEEVEEVVCFECTC